MPLMVTGGIRRYPVAAQVVGSGIAMAGMATALAVDPHLPRAWRADPAVAPALRPITFKNKVLASVAYMAMVKHQMRCLSRGQRTRPNVLPACALLAQQWDTLVKNRRYRRWMQALAR